MAWLKSRVKSKQVLFKLNPNAYRQPIVLTADASVIMTGRI